MKRGAVFSVAVFLFLGCALASDETITNKVFFDVEIDGKPAGAWTVGVCLGQQMRLIRK
jgi:hypothetical protein